MFAAFNTDAQIRRHRIGREGHTALVIDNALLAPHDIVARAAEARFSPVREAGNYYPGLRAPAPKEYARGLTDFLRPLIEQNMDAPTHTLVSARCAFSIAVLPPERLTVAQRLPHFDTTDEKQIAAVHYLCAPRHGGLSFYRHRRTGFEAITQGRSKEYFETLKSELAERGEPPRGYVTESALFEKTAEFDAAFDRIVVYHSNLLHSGAVNAEALSPEPTLGRLTTTLFARFQQPA